MSAQAIDLSSAGATSPGGAPYRVIYCGSAPFLAWRVTAGNGRVLGEAVDRFATTTQAAASLRETSARVAELAPSYSHPGSGVGWGWVAVGPGGDRIAHGTRSYERRATCVTGYERFVAALRSMFTEAEQPSAEPAVDIVVGPRIGG